ncbi:MAG: dTDP-4-dehydrorhamnose 3,5-epimerase [Candidatus Margulisbacteria bacterium]|jgi:dTDP-4-dehydrorhamnose 3,5-epimerase|nr:dTDP-4-dehydrorhamnose 3,5-epimerase [Candidatus Margulisiibacteriota bacterium]
MEKFKVTRSPLPGLLVIEPHAFADDRGFFMETYNRDAFSALGLNLTFVQDNHSRSKKGVVRGMHYQLAAAAMGKLVSCSHGAVFDVGLDLRKGSPTFGQWYGERLSGADHKMLYLPPGFAHGFMALEDDSDVLYKCTNVWSPAHERAIVWNDPAVGIKWPLGQAIVNGKDSQAPLLKDAETDFVFRS